MTVAAAMAASPGSFVRVEASAAYADEAMKQFDKRWEWYSGGFGDFWQLKKRKDKEK